MRKTIDVTARYEFLQLAHVLIERLRCATRLDLFNFTGAVQHLSLPAEVVNRTEYKIEKIPISLHPAYPACRGEGIIVQFDSGEDLDVRILLSQAVDDCKI